MNPTTNAIVPYFGCARMIASDVGSALKGCRWVGIPFCGGMPEVQYIDAPSIVCNDLHRHVINLAMVAACPQRGPKLYRLLRRLPFDQAILEQSQQNCQDWERHPWDGHPSIKAACDYFTAQWMGRSGKSGTDGEFMGKISTRWNGNGGDSNTRFRSAVSSLVAWRRILRRCNFTCVDAFDFLDRCNDEPGIGIYVDPPWPVDGSSYRHKFSDADCRRLAERLNQFKAARVVLRFGSESTLIKELFADWDWQPIQGRTQANSAKAEALITNGRKPA